MRRLFNLGSINIDHVYRVPHLVCAGETLSSQAYDRGAGGKGFNQSIAAARAGAAVVHIGAIGGDGRWLSELLAKEGVDVSGIRETEHMPPNTRSFGHHGGGYLHRFFHGCDDARRSGSAKLGRRLFGRSPLRVEARRGQLYSPDG